MKTHTLSMAILLLAATGAQTSQAVSLVLADIETGGGGDNDGQGKCDIVGSACAAAAAVALDGCAVAKVNGDGWGFAVVAVFPAYAEAHVDGKLTVCASFATGQSATAMATVPGAMSNSVNAHEGLAEYWDGPENENSRSCINNPLQVTVCGPTGASYTLSSRKCVSAVAQGSALIPMSFEASTPTLPPILRDPPLLGRDNLPTVSLVRASPVPSGAFGLVGAAEATAAAESISCDALPHEGLAQSTLRSDAMTPEVAAAVREAFAQAAEAKAGEARDKITQGSDSPTLQLLADQIHAAMLEDLNEQIDAAIAQV